MNGRICSTVSWLQIQHGDEAKAEQEWAFVEQGEKTLLCMGGVHKA